MIEAITVLLYGYGVWSFLVKILHKCHIVMEAMRCWRRWRLKIQFRFLLVVAAPTSLMLMCMFILIADCTDETVGHQTRQATTKRPYFGPGPTFHFIVCGVRVCDVILVYIQKSLY